MPFRAGNVLPCIQSVLCIKGKHAIRSSHSLRLAFFCSTNCNYSEEGPLWQFFVLEKAAKILPCKALLRKVILAQRKEVIYV